MKKQLTLSATALKCIAILAMTLDHAALVFVQPDTALYFVLRCIGRLTAPMMCFFIAEGFHFTRSRKKYLLRMLLFAAISQPVYFVMLFGRPPCSAAEFFMHLNVMFTLSISIGMLMILTSSRIRKEAKWILVLVCAAGADLCDWSYIIPAWVLVFFWFRESERKRTLAFIGVSVLLLTQRYLPEAQSFPSFSFQYGVLLALIPLRLYHGKRGGGQSSMLRFVSRWAFYAYYPLHMAVLTFLRLRSSYFS